jgi:hypothetical protein
MTWPIAAVVVAVVLALAGIMKAAIYAQAETRGVELGAELDAVWSAIELTSRDVERITPPEVSLGDQ